MYGIDGRAELTEEIWSTSRATAARRVRIGNGAAEQLQLDIYGELVDSVYLYNQWGSDIHHDAWEDLTRVVDWVCGNWDQADEGIWEVRGGRKNFTYSRLMCWVAIERAIRLAARRGLPADVITWQTERDRIYRQIMSRGWNEERQAFVQHYETTVLDAGRPGDAALPVRGADRPALARDARRDHGGARQRQPRLPLQRRGGAGRARGRGGDVLDLQLLVRRGARAGRAGR